MDSKEIDNIIDTLRNCQIIQEEEVKSLCEKAKEQLVGEENVIYLSSPITVLDI